MSSGTISADTNFRMYLLLLNYNMRQVNTELYRTASKPDLRAAL